MNRLQTSFRVEITEQEAETLTEELAIRYKALKTAYEGGNAKAYERMKEVRELRDFFGSLNGHIYMGADA